jgi:hypothetical protein
MEKTTATRHIALIENCTMSAIGLMHLFAMPPLSDYKLHLFTCADSLKAAFSHTSFFRLFIHSQMRVKNAGIVFPVCGSLP